jgi:hypothetical protein
VEESTLNGQVCKIPWMAPGTTLKEYLLLTFEHLSNHRMQLFPYLRLPGVKVGTGELYGGRGVEGPGRASSGKPSGSTNSGVPAVADSPLR